LSQVDIVTEESIKERERKTIKMHPDSSFLSDMTGTRVSGRGQKWLVVCG